MRATNRERETGGVDPNEVAASQGFDRISEGATTIHSGSEYGGVRVEHVSGDSYDPLGARMTDAAHVTRFRPSGPPMRNLTLDADEYARLSKLAAERGCDVIDLLKDEEEL